MSFNRQARAGYKYWPPCGVPVIMQHKFQQFLFMNPGVLQFINRRVDIPAACRSWSAQCTLCSRPYSGMVVTCLLLCSDRCPGWGAQKTVEFRSCRFSGVRNAWFDYVYMFCIIQGGFWKNFYDFPRDVGGLGILWSILVVDCTHGR